MSFGSFFSGLSASQVLATANSLGLSASQTGNLFSGLMGQSVKSQVTVKLSGLLSNLGNPAGWNAVSSGVLEQIAEIKGLPASVVPMLQSLATYTNIGEITSTVTAIEGSITN
jgi:hypothetical protein